MQRFGCGASVRRAAWENEVQEGSMKCMYVQWGLKMWTGFNWLKMDTNSRLLYCGIEPSGYIKCGEFLYELWSD
jgi:hypothetical protein